MYLILKLLFTFHKKIKIEFLVLLFGIILTNFAEVVSIAVIPSYISIVANSDLIFSNNYLNFIYEYFNFQSIKSFLITIAILIILAILVANSFLVVITYLTKRFLNKLNNELLRSLFTYYINLKFEKYFHDKTSQSQITAKLLDGVGRLTAAVILPFLEVLKRSFAITLMILILFYVEPLLTLYIVIFFTLTSLGFYFGFFKKLRGYSDIVTSKSIDKVSIISETFNALREIRFLGIENDLIREFFKTNIRITRADLKVYLAANMPRYILEVIAATLFLSIIIYLVSINLDFESMIFALSFIAIAAYKILPSLHTIILNTSTLQGNFASYYQLKEDLDASYAYRKNIKIDESDAPKFLLKNSLRIENLFYKYYNKREFVLKDINLEINLNKNVYIIGETGSGKSTLLDIISGILMASEGKIYADGVEIPNSDLRNMKHITSYVPQQINFFNRSLVENITLNFIAHKDNDVDYVNKLMKILNLEEFVSKLPNGLNTNLGDRLQQLSGGQRQRISVARALYRKKSILLLDEATSAIDVETEKLIFENINKLDFIQSIISITHRQSSIDPNSNCIYLKNGGMVFQGLYKDKPK